MKQWKVWICQSTYWSYPSNFSRIQSASGPWWHIHCLPMVMTVYETTLVHHGWSEGQASYWRELTRGELEFTVSIRKMPPLLTTPVPFPHHREPLPFTVSSAVDVWGPTRKVMVPMSCSVTFLKVRVWIFPFSTEISFISLFCRATSWSFHSTSLAFSWETWHRNVTSSPSNTTMSFRPLTMVTSGSANSPISSQNIDQTIETLNNVGWRGLLEVIWSNHCSKQGQLTAGCSAPHPAELYVPPRMEITQLLKSRFKHCWLTTFSVRGNAADIFQLVVLFLALSQRYTEYWFFFNYTFDNITEWISCEC